MAFFCGGWQKKFYYGLNGPENQTENVERKKGQTASDVGGGSQFSSSASPKSAEPPLLQ